MTDGSVTARSLLSAALVGSDPYNQAERVLERLEARGWTVARSEDVPPPAETDGESTVASEAHGLVYGDREDAYEHPRKSFTRSAIIWQAVLMDKLADGESITPQDVVMCMAGIKLGREAGGSRRDNRVDLAGYAICLDRLETGR